MGIEDSRFRGFTESNRATDRLEAVRSAEIERIRRDGSLHGQSGRLAVAQHVTKVPEACEQVRPVEVVDVQGEIL